MNAQIIEDILNQAKVDKNGRIINKGRLNDMFHSEHLKVVKKCSIPDVVNRREQLVAFSEWLSERDFTCDMTSPEDWVDMFLKSH